MVQCEAEKDSVWGLVFPATVAGFSYSRQCPQNGTGTTLGIIIIHDCMCVDMHVCIGTATRFCTLGGVWEAVNTDNCTSEVISSLNDRVRLCSYCSTLHYNEYIHCHLYTYWYYACVYRQRLIKRRGHATHYLPIVIIQLYVRGIYYSVVANVFCPRGMSKKSNSMLLVSLRIACPLLSI